MVHTEIQNFASKSDLRHFLLKKRLSLSSFEKQTASKQFFNQFLFFCKNVLESFPKQIGIYHAFKGEVCLSMIQSHFFELQSKLFLPVIQGKSMYFSPYIAHDSLHSNMFGILEPVCKSRINFLDLDMIILPMVAFDQTGNRVGMGGGFYDRLLEHATSSRKTIFTGAAYEFQKVQNCFSDSWDIRLDYAITDQKIYCFK